MERFWNKVDKKGPDECWEWKAAERGRGYGSFKLNYKTHLAHRISWLLTHGELPEKLVCHKCDNRKCVNPNHLFLGTHADNSKDMLSKGRRHNTKGEYNGRAILTESDILAIRASDKTNLKLADHYGVTHQTISEIRRYNVWKHIP